LTPRDDDIIHGGTRMWYRGFWGMNPRYGWDNLSIFLILLGLILLTWEYTFITGILIGGYGLWRVFSKDIEKRRNEQIAFERWVRKLGNRLNVLYYKSGINKLGQKIREFFASIKRRRYYLIIKCPKCSQKLRLPRGKGQLIVTCKNCGFKFKKRT